MLTKLIVAVIAVALARWLIVKFGSSDLANQLARGASAGLSEQETRSLIKSARWQIENAYSDGVHRSRLKGENAQSSHQVGARDAATAALRRRGVHRDAIEREAAPFAAVSPDIGKDGLIEYLIWKYFPERANLDKVKLALHAFADVTTYSTERARDFTDANVCDWQQLLDVELASDEPIQSQGRHKSG